jgi:hypothetical protein
MSDNDFENEVLPGHRKLLFEKIVARGLPVAQFSGDKSIPKEFTIRFENSKLYFKVTRVTHKSFKNVYNTFQHGYPNFKVKDTMSISLEELMTHFDGWLNNVKKLINQREIVDPWDELQDRLQQEHQQYHTSKFTVDEIERIEPVLDNTFNDMVQNLELTNIQIESLKQDFEELKESLKTDTKRKWVRKYLAVAIGFAIDLALEPEKAKRAYSYLMMGFEILKKIGNFVISLSPPV